MKLTDKEIETLLKEMELEQPSMSFSRNVMEQVRLEHVPLPLKTKVDPRIIYGVFGVFLVAILAVVVYAVINGTSMGKMPKINISISVDLDKATISGLLTGFLFADLIIALIYFDRVLRKKAHKSQAKDLS